MSRTFITVVEDEPAIADVLQYNLEREGFEVEVVERGDRVMPAVHRRVPDLILLDLMLPGLDGLELARQLRRDEKTAAVPIVMVTAKDEEVDRIVGLELGADDYVTKPFSAREVVLRVKAVLRRSRSEAAAGAVLQVGDLRLDAGAHRCWAGGREVHLTVTELRLLKVLAERRGRVQSRDVLLSDVWGYTAEADSRTVDTHVRRLRAKLGETVPAIETVVGVGYRLGLDEP